MSQLVQYPGPNSSNQGPFTPESKIKELEDSGYDFVAHKIWIDLHQTISINFFDEDGNDVLFMNYEEENKNNNYIIYFNYNESIPVKKYYCVEPANVPVRVKNTYKNYKKELKKEYKKTLKELDLNEDELFQIVKYIYDNTKTQYSTITPYD